jgi:hypothetical protein
VIYVWVRASPDWEDEDEFWAQVPPRVRPRVELWNSTIGMPFHVFRHRVREIAALNQARVENVTYAEWDEIPDGARVVPVDDDDWFAPNLAEILEREWGPERGICWNPCWIGVPSDFGHWIHATRRSLLPFTPWLWTCDTNNYALVRGPGTKPLFAAHGIANEWAESPPGRNAVKRIGRRLSVNNRTLASQTSLRPTTRRGEIDRTRLLERLRAYKRLYRRRWWQSEPGWSRPYVAMMAELMDEVEPR